MFIGVLLAVGRSGQAGAVVDHVVLGQHFGIVIAATQLVAVVFGRDHQPPRGRFRAKMTSHPGPPSWLCQPPLASVSRKRLEFKLIARAAGHRVRFIATSQIHIY